MMADSTVSEVAAVWPLAVVVPVCETLADAFPADGLVDAAVVPVDAPLDGGQVDAVRGAALLSGGRADALL